MASSRRCLISDYIISTSVYDLQPAPGESLCNIKGGINEIAAEAPGTVGRFISF